MRDLQVNLTQDRMFQAQYKVDDLAITLERQAEEKAERRVSDEVSDEAKKAIAAAKTAILAYHSRQNDASE